VSSDIELARNHPVSVQNCREVYGVHTCDKRHPKSWIAENFPSYTFEKGFTEEVRSPFAPREPTQVTCSQDELWTPDDRETDAHVNERALFILRHIWDRYPADTCEYEGYGPAWNLLTSCQTFPSLLMADSLMGCCVWLVEGPIACQPEVRRSKVLPKTSSHALSLRLGVIPIVIRRAAPWIIPPQSSPSLY
jgi:hypothetical protein